MSQYSRSLSVEMIVAYVDGRPMPCSSSGEVLVAVHVEQRDHVAVFHGRQDAVVLALRFSVVHIFLVDGDVARLDQRGAIGAQRSAGAALAGVRAGLHVHGHGV
jgi:hypothetical protein